MKPVEVSKQISASVEEVFRAFSDLDQVCERITDIVKLEVLQGPAQMAKGTRWRETRVMFGKEATEEMEVTAIDPPHNYRVEAESNGAHYTTNFRFEPKDGGTLVVMTFEARPLNLIARIMGFLMAPMMRKSITNALGRDMDDLKDYLEQAQN